MPQTSNPWKGIHRSTAARYMRDVDDGLNPQHLSLRWTRNSRDEVGLELDYSPLENTLMELPRFKGVRAVEDTSHHTINLELTDPEMSEAFLDVCKDIIAQLQRVPPESSRRAFILRLQRWARLFNNVNSKMSHIVQQGLIGELQCLRKLLVLEHSPASVLASWTGPDGGIHDFSIGSYDVEVKTHAGAGSLKVIISSADQLMLTDERPLYLYAVVMIASQDGGQTLTQFVDETRELLDSPIDRMVFDTKLAGLGYSGTERYTEKWRTGPTHIYRIEDGFPRITRDMISPSISAVHYGVDLTNCDEFEVSFDEFERQVRDGR